MHGFEPVEPETREKQIEAWGWNSQQRRKKEGCIYPSDELR